MGAVTNPNILTSLLQAALLSTPQNGAIEYDGNHIYFTLNGTRYQLDQQLGTYQILTADTTIVPGVRYYVNPSTNITLNLTLPATFKVDDPFVIFGKTGTFKVIQNAGQQIRSIQYTTTQGTSGSLTSNNQYCTLTMRGLTANTELLITTIQGTYSVV